MGLGPVLVHSSLRSFGYVDGGAEAVCQALVETCGTVMMPAGTWDFTGISPPPGVARAHNAYEPTASWQTFDEELAGATPFRMDLPVDRWLGRIPDTLRLMYSPPRSSHPLFSYAAVGPAAEELLQAQRLDWPLGPIEALRDLGGDILLLGVGHTSNTTIHLAEQLLGRSRFYRYAKAAEGVWMELPNIPGESHRFDLIEPELRSATTEVQIGQCRARRIPVAAVIAAAQRMIVNDPAALLCDDDPACRCAAAYQQRLAELQRTA
jgi:aminoglycoside 3-N-acetyltransferase